MDEATKLQEAAQILRVLIIAWKGKVEDIFASIPNYQNEYVRKLSRRIMKAENLLDAIEVRLLHLA